MKQKLFLDTNVVLDFFLEREPFVKDATNLFLLRENEQVDFYLSALTLANLAFYAERSKKDPAKIISLFLKWVNVVDLEKEFFSLTIASRFRDFEDGLQYYSALKVKGIDAIVTRNKKDFTPSEITVLTPTEFLKMYNH